jgi:hypothetical protein
VAYSVRLHPRVSWQIARWGLSDFMLVEVYLHLKEELTSDPPFYLGFDRVGPGAYYVFEARDPQDPDFQVIFTFRVFFDPDEIHLNVVNGSYWRNYAPIPQSPGSSSPPLR